MPATQVTHESDDDAPSIDDAVPRGQRVQTPRPGMDAKEPGEHSVQLSTSVAPRTADADPAAQLLHVLLPWFDA